MSKADATAWFGAPPPDLSVEARVRGTDWLYSYLNAFYRDENAPTGWNNLVFPNVAMPHVLWKLQGAQQAGRNRVRGSREGRGGGDRRQGSRDSSSAAPMASTS